MGKSGDDLLHFVSGFCLILVAMCVGGFLLVCAVNHVLHFVGIL